MLSYPPLVSILIPAYNAERWIAETINSALRQSWARKEIIVVDDGSSDNTLGIAKRYASKHVSIVPKANGGAAAARNTAYALSQGDYIQWLDADDLLAPDKLLVQMRAAESCPSRTLFSASWAMFAYRSHRATFRATALWEDLSPTEWLVRKMGQNLYMQTATWLTTRELAEAAGGWDTRLLSDDDGEYFCRVLLASEGVRFIPEARVFYRNIPSGRLSYIGTSNKSMDAMLISMKLHVQYLRSLEDSPRVRDACLRYIENWAGTFFPERDDILDDLQGLAKQLGGSLQLPKFGWKYDWISALAGPTVAKHVQRALPQYKARVLCAGDRIMSHWDRGGQESVVGSRSLPVKRPQMSE